MDAGGRIAAAIESTATGPLGDAHTHDTLEGASPPSPLHGEEGWSARPRDGPDWEDATNAAARSVDAPDLPSEASLRSCVSTASMKVKNVKKLSFTKGHFPKLAECAHFHYENVDFGTVQLSLAEDQNDVVRNGLDSKELVYLVQICCQARSWIVKRTYEDFRVLDKHLHLCIYDRRFSQLTELPRFDNLRDKAETLAQMLTAYLSRLSAIADNKINCGPALTWMEIDNKGNHLLVHDESSINVPAIAAAHVRKRYIAQAADELSFEVGDIVSVIDMPPKEDTGWWRGKHGFQVGFFPCECVELISEKIPPSVTSSIPKPVSKKHGKLITFLRTFMKSRPTKQKLKQRGILRERVFGCDLGEHLLNSGHDVPQVIKSCTEFIEKHGVVDGIYRLSGIASNIQKLRHEFDSEHIPDLTKDIYIQDIHSVGSLCKLYFRELPNPLLTYQLYEKFSDAVSAATDEERLVKIHDVIQQLPPPHYRTLEFLMRHLSHLATFSYVTNMHCKNLAIVWAPNLLRSKQIESACFSGTSAFMEVRMQSVVVEFILSHVDVLFSPKLSTLIREGPGHSTLSRPKSLLICSPSTKLLTLEEAQARTQAQLVSPLASDSKYIEVGEGPGALQGKFHTVIEFPAERKRAPVKSPRGSWRSFFNIGKSSSTAKRKLHRHPSEPNEIKTMALPALPGGRGDTGTLRSAKSEESLSSHNFEGESKLYRSRRPRSTSDALSTSFNDELLDSRVNIDVRGHPCKDSGKDSVVPALISPPRPAEDVDFCPPDTGMASLDFDPMSFRCGLQPARTAAPECRRPGSRGKSRGTSTDAGPSAPSGNVASPSLPPDVSPAQGEAGDARLTSPAEKAALAVSPKGEREPSKATPVVIADFAAMPKCDGRPSSGTEGRASAAAGHTEPSQPTRHESQPEPGAVTFDCTPGLVRSVSLITPQPPVKNAARMLALALAESAQQASLTQRASSEPPTPASPTQRQDPLCVLRWPAPPLPTSRSAPSPSNAASAESQTWTGARSPSSLCGCHSGESGLGRVLPARGGPVAEQAPEGHGVARNPGHPAGARASSQDDAARNGKAEPRESLKPTLSQAESGPLRHTCGAMPARSPEHQLATTALCMKEAANAANFRSILAEASTPASVQMVLPHAPLSPPNLAYQYTSREEGAPAGDVYMHPWVGPVGQSTPYHFQPDHLPLQLGGSELVSRPRPDNHYSTLAPRSHHQSIRYKGHHGDELSPNALYRHRGQRYAPMDGASVYPTIRRVRSLHAPPEDTLHRFQRQACQDSPFPSPACQSHPCQRPVPSDIHQVQPYFENGKVQYRYSPYADAFDMEPHRASRLGPGQAYTLRGAAPHPAKMVGDVEHHHSSSRRVLPTGKDPGFVSRDVRPLPGMKGATLYQVWDSGPSDRHFGQSERRDGAAQRKLQGPAFPQPYLPQGELRSQETTHRRSRSDSGKELLISTEEPNGQCRVTMVSRHSPEQPLSEPDASPAERRGEAGGLDARSALLLKQSRSVQSYAQYVQESRPLKPSLHKEHSCPDFKHREPTEGGRLHGQDGPAFRTLSGYPKEIYQFTRVKARAPPRPQRSQSVKAHQHQMALERDRRDRSYSVLVKGRPRGTKCAPSHYDNLDGYLPAAQPKPPKSGRGGAGVFPNHGCMPPHSHRLYSTALGRGGFPQAQLRPEAEVYAE